MKFLLLIVIVSIVFTLLVGKARKSGRLNESANKAVGGLADALRFFVYAMLALIGIAGAVLIYGML